MRYEYESYADGIENMHQCIEQCCKQLGIKRSPANVQILDFYMHAAWSIVQHERDLQESKEMIEACTKMGMLFGTMPYRKPKEPIWYGEDK